MYFSEIAIKKNNRHTGFIVFLVLFLNTPFYFSTLAGVQKLCINLILLSCFFVFFRRYTTIFIGNKKCLQYLKLMILIYFLLIWFSIVVPLLYATNDYSYSIFLTNNILRIIKYQCVLFLLYQIRTKHDIFLLFLKLFVVATVIHVFSTIVFLLVPSLKDIWFSIIQFNASEKLERVTEYITRYGISGFSGFVHTHICSMAVIFSIFLILNDKKRKNFFYYACMIICLVGNFFYGRAGMLCSIAFISIFLGYKIFLKRDINLLFFLISIAITLTLLLLYLMSTNKVAITWFNWAFEPLINFFTKGTIRSSSSDWLVNQMFFMPETKTLLFGDGFFTNNYDFDSYYMKTDSGIMRPILFYGLFLTILEFSMVFILAIIIKRIMKKLNYQYIYVFVFSLLFEFVFFTIKGVIIQNEMDIYLIIISLLLLQYKNKYIIA